MTAPTTTTSLPARVQTIAELFTTMLPRLEQGQTVGKTMLAELQASKITNDIERETFVNRMVKIRQVYEKIQGLRMQVTRPLDELKADLMFFERDVDDTKKDNAFALAKQIITAYDQTKLEEVKRKEAAADLLKQMSIYKAEISASVGRACIEMLAGQERNLIAGMQVWESEMTLENFPDKEKQINTDTSPQLKMEKYDQCFHVNFNKKHLLSEEDTKSFIEGLKLIYPYDTYNKKYVQIVTEIKNSYRARMPSIKSQLIEAQKNKELEAKRQEEIKVQAEKAMKASEDAANKEVQEVVNQKDLSVIESDFIKQGQLDGVEAGPTKKIATFVDDSRWVKAFLLVVQEVASKGMTIKNAKGYIPPIGWWLTKFESLGKSVDGILLTEVPKTILKEKKTEE